MATKWENIILHCSDSSYGNAVMIDDWHRQRGWSKIGYHYVITNGHYFGNSKYNGLFDGSIEAGRNLDFDTWVGKNEVGAHALGMNSNSIGICLIGKKQFTDAQFAMTSRLVKFLIANIESLSVDRIYGHYQIESGKEQGKTCPNFDVPQYVDEYIRGIGAPV